MDWSDAEESLRTQWRELRDARVTAMQLGLMDAERQIASDEYKAILAWEVIADAMEEAEDPFFDTVSRETAYETPKKASPPEKEASPETVLTIVGGTDAVTNEENATVINWIGQHTEVDPQASFRPSDAWESFIASGLSDGYTRETFYRELKGCAAGAWRKTNTGAVYRGLRLI